MLTYGSRLESPMMKAKGLVIFVGLHPHLLALLLFIVFFLKCTSFISALPRSSHANSAPSRTSPLGVTFTLPDQLPSHHLIGHIPSMVPHFPFGVSRDFPVTSVLTDDLGLAVQLLDISDSGNLFTTTQIDRDNRDELCGPLKCCHLIICNLTLTVIFVHPKWDQLKVAVLLQFHDANDNAPKFAKDTFSLHIPEFSALPTDDPHGTKREPKAYGLPAATDPDSDPNSIILYQLRANDFVRSSFRLVTNLEVNQVELIVNADAQLDYESVQHRIFEFTVEAIDGGQPSRSGSLLVVIHLLDLNDNVPQFLQPSQTVNIYENTTYNQPIYAPNVVDRDSADNALVRFSFGPSFYKLPQSVRKHFHLDSNTGELMLTTILDHEQYNQRVIDLSIIAYDSGNPPLSATGQVKIIVLDINDNAPQLIVQENRTIDENSPAPQLAIRLSVRDLDEISQSVVKCQPGQNPLVPLRLEQSLDSKVLSLFTTAEIDYEATPSLDFSIICKDGAEPAQITRFNLTVGINDVNDNVPRFSQGNKVYKVRISEAEHINKLLLTVHADDEDSGANGCLEYSLFQPTAQQFTDQSYHLASYQSNRVQFSIHYFTIDSRSGSIFLTKHLDYETAQVIIAGIKVSDNCGEKTGQHNTATTLLYVFVEDANDNYPELISPSVIPISENIPVGSQVGRLRFKDPDTGTGGQVVIQSFHSESTTLKRSRARLSTIYGAQAFFKVTPNGSIFTEHAIDREKDAVILLGVMAVDLGTNPQLTSSFTITFNVVDVNDNEPRLIQPKTGSTITHTPTLIEDWKPISFHKVSRDSNLEAKMISFETLLADIEAGRPNGDRSTPYVGSWSVQTIQGEDKDVEKNGKFSFRQKTTCNSSKVFFLESSTGELRTRVLLRESARENSEKITSNDLQVHPPPGLYHLCLEIFDHGDPQLHSSGDFYVKVFEPITKAAYQAMWASDSAVDLSQKPAARTILNRSYEFASPQQTVRTKMSGTMSNVIISLLIITFALTLMAALLAAMFWVRSKHARRRPTTPPRSAQPTDESEIISLKLSRFDTRPVSEEDQTVAAQSPTYHHDSLEDCTRGFDLVPIHQQPIILVSSGCNSMLPVSEPKTDLETSVLSSTAAQFATDPSLLAIFPASDIITEGQQPSTVYIDSHSFPIKLADCVPILSIANDCDIPIQLPSENN